MDRKELEKILARYEKRLFDKRDSEDMLTIYLLNRAKGNLKEQYKHLLEGE